jgi:hypothetical protein
MTLTMRARSVVVALCAAATLLVLPAVGARATGPVQLSANFASDGLNLSQWTYLIGMWPTKDQIYTPTQVKVDGGGLHLLASQPRPFTVNLAGGIESRQSFLYGQFDVVARLPYDHGLWPAAWLTAGKTGEIDIFEAWGSHPTWFQTTVHAWNGTGEPEPRCVQVGWRVTPTAENPHPACQWWLPKDKSGQPVDWTAAFHTWRMVWSPSGCSFYMDPPAVGPAKPFWQTNWSPSTPMQLVLNLGMGTYWDGYPDSTDVWPASLDIRSVTVRSL